MFSQGRATSSIFKGFFSPFFSSFVLFPITTVFSPTGKPAFANSAFYLKPGHKITTCIHLALNFEGRKTMLEM